MVSLFWFLLCFIAVWINPTVDRPTLIRSGSNFYNLPKPTSGFDKMIGR